MSGWLGCVLLALGACRHPLPVVERSAVPHLTLICDPECAARPGVWVGAALLILSLDGLAGVDEVSLSHSVDVRCEGTENGLAINATAPTTSSAFLAGEPVDLAGRCTIGGEVVVFVVTLADRPEAVADRPAR